MNPGDRFTARLSAVELSTLMASLAAMRNGLRDDAGLHACYVHTAHEFGVVPPLTDDADLAAFAHRLTQLKPDAQQ